MRRPISITENDILLVVDIQNDFCPGGALSVQRGDEVVPVVNRCAALFRHVVLTQDWHKAGHHSFASAHPGREPYQTITLSYGEQVLWPDHCVQDTFGAAFHSDLAIPHAELILRKGFRPGDRLLLRLFRERSQNADGSRRLSPGTRFCACLHLWACRHAAARQREHDWRSSL